MRRSTLLRKILPELGVDGILITDLNNIRYLTGFTGSSAFAAITKNHSIFVTDFRYKEQSKQEVKSFTLKMHSGEKTELIKKLAERYKIKRLGFESRGLNYHTYKKLCGRNLRLAALDDTVENFRLVKSHEELLCIKRAVRRAEGAFNRLQPFIKSGVTEQALANRLEGFLKEEGCKKIPFGVIVASGPKSALPHASPTGRKIKKGDLVIFDWGGECEGYYSDITRTVAIGRRHIERQRMTYSIVLEAQERAIKAVKSGERAAVVDAAARDFIKEKGCGRYFGHGTGHGVGLAVHERPVISWQSKEILESDMVFTIEPGIYLPGFGGVRIEDMVSVGINGAKTLTTLPGELKIIKG